jgi:hypothetical protein
MFLRRLQQLESESEAASPGLTRPPSRLELQRQKAHAQQVGL